MLTDEDSFTEVEVKPTNCTENQCRYTMKGLTDATYEFSVKAKSFDRAGTYSSLKSIHINPMNGNQSNAFKTYISFTKFLKIS